VSLKGLFLSF